jgi:hypothetical protein
VVASKTERTANNVSLIGYLLMLSPDVDDEKLPPEPQELTPVLRLYSGRAIPFPKT